MLLSKMRACLSISKHSTAITCALMTPSVLFSLLLICYAGWAVCLTSDVQSALSRSLRVVQLDSSITQAQFQRLVESNLSLGQDAGKIVVTLTYETANARSKVAHTTATFPLTIPIPALERLSVDYTARRTVALAY
jgi:hypothetical protein